MYDDEFDAGEPLILWRIHCAELAGALLAECGSIDVRGLREAIQALASVSGIPRDALTWSALPDGTIAVSRVACAAPLALVSHYELATPEDPDFVEE